MKIRNQIPVRLASIAVFFIFAIACSENPEDSADKAIPNENNLDVEPLLKALRDAKDSLSVTDKAGEIDVQLSMGENDDIQKIWVRLDIKASTESRLIGIVLEVPDSWQLIQAGQPVAITDLSSLHTWRKLDTTAE